MSDPFNIGFTGILSNPSCSATMVVISKYSRSASSNDNNETDDDGDGDDDEHNDNDEHNASINDSFQSGPTSFIAL